MKYLKFFCLTAAVFALVFSFAACGSAVNGDGFTDGGFDEIVLRGKNAEGKDIVTTFYADMKLARLALSELRSGDRYVITMEGKEVSRGTINVHWNVIYITFIPTKGESFLGVITSSGTLKFSFELGPPGGGGKGNSPLPGTITITNGSTAAIGDELSANYNGEETVTYQWYKDGAAIQGATSSEYTPTEAGSYTVTISAPGFGSITSSAVVVGGGGPVYAIGETGPGGGKIIYVSESGFTVQGYGNPGDNGYFATYTAHYLEAAPANMATYLHWASSGKISTLLTGTFGTAIGTGKANTALILQAGNDPDASAALACKNYTGGGKTDWFLPSSDELKAMFDARSHLGISSGWFWSSSQNSNTHAVAHMFTDVGFPGTLNKNTTNTNVRAVRAF